ncbi:hypothetical protein C8F04DRAFT_1183974 [Mycena alexandri]|uniref:Uncharacterized protein n=1 Tax=Mycena alexandri TaxID=1745969 RepID=A0AAD6SU99_9AGAR|nr:hypothetical protein C8F04DRAFT_1183974 [Mycena alexandri]
MAFCAPYQLVYTTLPRHAAQYFASAGTSAHVVTVMLEHVDETDSDSEYDEAQLVPAGVAAARARAGSTGWGWAPRIHWIPAMLMLPPTRCIMNPGEAPIPWVVQRVCSVGNPFIGGIWGVVHLDDDRRAKRECSPGLPEPRIINGGLYAGQECHEFASPYFTITAPTIPLTEWWSEERRIKEAFQTLYPTLPPHPDRASASPVFLCDTRRLIAHLACAHAIFLIRSVHYREAEEIEARFSAAIEPLLVTKYLSAWLDRLAYEVYRLGANWSRERADEAFLYAPDKLAATMGTNSVWLAWGNTSGTITNTDTTGGWGTGGGQTDTGAWGTAIGWGPHATNAGSGTGAIGTPAWTPGGWGMDNELDVPRRGRQYPKNSGRPFHPPRRGRQRTLLSPLKQF